MVVPVLLSGFLLGAAGSMHCIGMCGPLSLALPVQQFSKSKKFLSLFYYQIGRILTYSSMGLITGLAGRRLHIAGYQQYFSILMGIIVLCFAILYFIGKRNIHFSFLRRFYLLVQRIILGLLKAPASSFSFLLIGMANGLLPCGMIYVALATTLSMPVISQSVLFMAMFGAGTLPAMMLVGYAGTMIKPAWRVSFRQLIPLFISLMGILLILRGMNLGIPFISPAFDDQYKQAVSCHP